MKPLYYFFHGFAALDWYRDFQYFDSKSFEKFVHKLKSIYKNFYVNTLIHNQDNYLSH